MVEIVESLSESADLKPGDRVRTLRGTSRGIIVRALEDGRLGSPHPRGADPQDTRFTINLKTGKIERVVFGLDPETGCKTYEMESRDGSDGSDGKQRLHVAPVAHVARLHSDEIDCALTATLQVVSVGP